jgi:hypothetical protein
MKRIPLPTLLGVSAVVGVSLCLFVAFYATLRPVYIKDHAPLTLWGDDLKALYPEAFAKPTVENFYITLIQIQHGPSFEFGLRSDGVVVWREVKANHERR